MKRLILIFLFPFALLGQHGKIVKVLDGDTVIIQEGAEQKILRLSEIDCPEISQPFGKEAKAFTAGKILNRQVSYKSHGIDKYQRTIATVEYGTGAKLNISHELVKAGLAWHYKKYSDSAELSYLEKSSKAKKIGIWSVNNPVEPYRWRKSKNSQIHLKIYNKRTAKRKVHKNFEKRF